MISHQCNTTAVRLFYAKLSAAHHSKVSSPPARGCQQASSAIHSNTIPTYLDAALDLQPSINCATFQDAFCQLKLCVHPYQYLGNLWLMRNSEKRLDAAWLECTCLKGQPKRHLRSTDKEGGRERCCTHLMHARVRITSLGLFVQSVTWH